MVFYFVQRGETLFAIARRYQTTVHAIVAANRLEDPNAICPGQALIIPRPGEVPSPPPGGIVHLVRPAETLIALAAKFGTTVGEILRANQIAHPEFVLPGQQLVIPEPAEPGDDWPTLGRTPGRAAATAVSLRGLPVEAWSHTPRRNVGLRPSAPVIRYERVYVGLGDGCFYAFDRHTGAIKWRANALEGDLDASLEGCGIAAPVVYDGLVYLCVPDGLVRAVDAHTGRMVWQVRLGGPVTAAPLVVDGVLYVGCWDQHLYALEGKTGAIAWRTGLGGRILHPVAAGDDHLYVVTESGQLCSLDLTSGAIGWQTDAGASHPPVFAELLVISGGTAYDPTTGQVIWRLEADISPAVRLDQVFYPACIVDLFTGEVRQGSPGALTDGETHLLVGDLQVVATAGAGLLAWDAAADQIRWQLELEAPVVPVPAVAPGSLILTLEDGSVVAYRIEPEGC